MSERRHDLEDVDIVFEVRVWADAGADGGHWRTLALTVERDDATIVAAAVVSSEESSHRFAEVWGPGRETASHRTCVARFPVPSREERQEMWLEAAEENFSRGYTDLRH